MSYQDIPGHSGFLWLYQEAVDHFPSGSLFVEVGVALGHSIAYLAETAFQRGKTFEIHAVDPWAGTARNGEQQVMSDGEAGGDFALWCRMMLTHSPESLRVIKPFRMTGVEYWNNVATPTPRLVLLDGDHSYEAVMAELAAFQPVLDDGLGWLAGDDYDTINGRGVIQAVDEYFGKRVEVRGNTWVVR